MDKSWLGFVVSEDEAGAGGALRARCWMIETSFAARLLKGHGQWEAVCSLARRAGMLNALRVGVGLLITRAAGLSAHATDFGRWGDEIEAQETGPSMSVSWARMPTKDPSRPDARWEQVGRSLGACTRKACPKSAPERERGWEELQASSPEALRGMLWALCESYEIGRAAPEPVLARAPGARL